MRCFRSRCFAFWLPSLVLGVLLTVSGCGAGTGDVTGKVLHKGQPLKGGQVTFVNEGGGQSATSEIKEDGTYTVSKVSTGPVKICVDTETLNPAKRPKTPNYGPPPGQQGAGYNPSGGPSAAELAKRYTRIDPKYNKTETTPLTYTVKGGSQNYDIPLD